MRRRWPLLAERALAVEEGDWAVSKALMTGLIECTEPCALQTILRELNDLLRWGAFLTLFAASRESASALSSLESIALGQARRADDEGFSQSMTAYYRLMLQSVLAFLERAGMIDVDPHDRALGPRRAPTVYLLPNRVLYSDTACNKAMFDQV